MKKRHLALFLLILLLSLYGCEGLIKKSPPITTQGMEIFVAENHAYPRPIWCGGGGLLVYMADWGKLVSYDIRTSERQVIAERSIMPLTCTPDGERLIYLDSKGIGWDDGSIEEETMGLWSYDFEAKAHRHLAIVYTNEVAPFGESILSPDGKKLLLGKRPKKRVNETESTPDIIWSETKRTASNFTWLADSSGVVSSHWNKELGRDVLNVSRFDPEKKTVTIDPGAKELLLSPVIVNDAFYIKAWDGKSAGARKILKCDFDPEKQSASCESLLKSNGDIIDFHILPDGDMTVFTEKGGRCLKIFKRGDETPRCITPPGEHFVQDFSITPDASLVAYTVKGKLYYRPFETEPKWEDSSGIFKENKEGLLIESFKENVRRDGDTLYLKTKSGAYRTYTNLQGCDPLSWCFYEFINYFEDVGFYVVFVRTHEGLSHVMISDKDGKEYYVHALPILSPDKGHLITVSVDDAGHAAHGVYIWGIEDSKLISEFDYEPTTEGFAYYYFKSWKDNKTIELYKQFIPTKKLCPNTNFAETKVTLRLEDDGWKIYEDLSPQNIKCDATSRY